LGGVALKRIEKYSKDMLTYFNEKWINEQNAKVSINNRSFRYGDGFFETIKFSQGKILGWSYHTERFFRTLEALHFDKPAFLTPDYLESNVHELVKRNGHTKLARVRVTVFRGDGGIYDPINHKPNILIQTWSLNPENNKLNINGLVTGIYTEGFKAADALANLKTNNYLLYAMAAMWAKKQHLNDALILNHKESIADATIANLWMMRAGTLITPSLSEGPVAGTMRAYLLHQLPLVGYPVSEEPITKEMLMEADEVFLSNAIYGIKWVRQIENKDYSGVQIQSIYKDIFTVS